MIRLPRRRFRQAAAQRNLLKVIARAGDRRTRRCSMPWTALTGWLPRLKRWAEVGPAPGQRRSTWRMQFGTRPISTSPIRHRVRWRHQPLHRAAVGSTRSSGPRPRTGSWPWHPGHQAQPAAVPPIPLLPPHPLLRLIRRPASGSMLSRFRHRRAGPTGECSSGGWRLAPLGRWPGGLTPPG